MGGGEEKTDDYSGHYVIASSRPPERRTLERRTLAPKKGIPVFAGAFWYFMEVHLIYKMIGHKNILIS